MQLNVALTTKCFDHWRVKRASYFAFAIEWSVCPTIFPIRSTLEVTYLFCNIGKRIAKIGNSDIGIWGILFPRNSCNNLNGFLEKNVKYLFLANSVDKMGSPLCFSVAKCREFNKSAWRTMIIFVECFAKKTSLRDAHTTHNTIDRMIIRCWVVFLLDTLCLWNCRSEMSRRKKLLYRYEVKKGSHSWKRWVVRKWIWRSNTYLSSLNSEGVINWLNT